MSLNSMDEYWVPEHVKDYLRRLGFVLPLDDMEPWIRSWDDWMSAPGSSMTIGTKTAWGACTRFTGGSIHPAMRVCEEWFSAVE